MLLGFQNLLQSSHHGTAHLGAAAGGHIHEFTVSPVPHQPTAATAAADNGVTITLWCQFLLLQRHFLTPLRVSATADGAAGRRDRPYRPRPPAG
jgi:hypothetical protein